MPKGTERLFVWSRVKHVENLLCPEVVRFPDSLEDPMIPALAYDVGNENVLDWIL
jgi:hypothetical protein